MLFVGHVLWDSECRSAWSFAQNGPVVAVLLSLFVREQRVEIGRVDLIGFDREPVVVHIVRLVSAVAAPLFVHLVHVQLCVGFGAAYDFHDLGRASRVFLRWYCPQKSFQLFRCKLDILFRKTFGLVKFVKVLSFAGIDNGIVVFPESRKESTGRFAFSFVAISTGFNFGGFEDLSSSTTFQGSFAFGILIVRQGGWLSDID